jgi:Tol biopolymer transport system component
MTLLCSGRLLAAVAFFAAAPLFAAPTEIVNATGIAVPHDANGSSSAALDVSQDGRFALFSSDASNLVPGDTNRRPDLFLYDADADTVERVSLRADGSQLDAALIRGSALGTDARTVMFSTNADGVVAGVSGAGWQIYERDRVAGTTTLVSRTAGGQPLPGALSFSGASADGRYVLLATALPLDPADTSGGYDLYRFDRQTGAYLLVTQALVVGGGNQGTTSGRISADGGTVAFISEASNLVANDTNDAQDLFVRDLSTATTLLASRTTGGQFHPQSFYRLPRGRALSADGRHFVFTSYAALDPLDTNDYADGYVFDRATQTIRRVTLASSGAQIADAESEIGSISADGSHIAFASQGSVLPGQSYSFGRSYRTPLASNAPTQIEMRPFSWGDDVSDCHLSGDAASVFCRFISDAVLDTQHNNFANLYRAVLQPATVDRVSRPLPAPVAATNNDSAYYWPASASADARYVAFDSLASNLVVGDFNDRRDLFLRDRLLGTTTRINRMPDGSEGSCGVGASRVSADGRYIAFESCDDLAPGASWGRQQVYRHDRFTGEIQLVSRSAAGQAADQYVQLVGMSGDGNVVALYTGAGNLLPQPLTQNANGDYFLKDVAAGTVVLASRRAGGGVDGMPTGAHLSADGRHLLFGHEADDLVDGDTNGLDDAFVFDRLTQQIERVSLDAAGNQLADGSIALGISRNGREILFYTEAALAGSRGIYVRDRVDGGIELVSRNNAGDPLNFPGTYAALSPDGNLVVLRCPCSDSGYVIPESTFVDLLYVYDRRSAHLSLITPADTNRYIESHAFAGNDAVLFASQANNLVANDANNHFRDVFIASGVGDVVFADGFAPVD